MELVETYGTPLKLTYLPDIDEKINSMKEYFATAFEKYHYNGRYAYHYCTKSSHFQHITEQVLKNNTGLEISSAFDIPIIWSLFENGLIDQKLSIICNGYKPISYTEGIVNLIHKGFDNILPILDSKEELSVYTENIKNKTIAIGIRICLSRFQSKSTEVNSRFGITANEIIPFYNDHIKNNSHVKVTTLHFFVENGIGDNDLYWRQLKDNMILYCEFKRINPYLNKIDIGGGMPFQEDIDHTFDYASCVDRIVYEIQSICKSYGVETPDIISEFGKYTVAEASATVFKVVYKKEQSDGKTWLFIDGSFISHLPDTWAINQHYPVLPVNNLHDEVEKVWISGLSCDKRDYYLSPALDNSVWMPKTKKSQYVCFFNTGAYQEVLSGFGGVNHCLTPFAKHLLISKNKTNKKYKVFAEEMTSRNALRILGY